VWCFPLGRRSIDILINLAERPGEIAARKALTDRAWSGATMEEASLRVQMAAIRKAPGERQFGNWYIEGGASSFVGSVVRIQ
jgi:DNA-binding winged helix-turn-helix (wHTH) protein